MFAIILLTVTTLMQAYVFLRAASVPFIRRHLSRQALLLAAVTTWGIAAGGFTFGHHGTGTIARWAEFWGMNWMAALFLAFAALLIVDLLTLFGLILRQPAPRLRGWALTVAAVLSLLALAQGMRPPVVSDHEVPLSGLPAALDGTVLAAVSDLHLGNLIGRDWLARRLDQIETLEPDMIVLLGDIFEGHGSESDDLVALFKGLAPPLGVWAVTGNHEFYSPGNSSIRKMEQSGFRILRDQWAEAAPGLILAGVDDLNIHRRRNTGGDPVTRALSGRPLGATVFLSHTPREYEKAAGLDTGLMLSGHTHGGQIWPFNFLMKRFYPKLAGRYQVNDMVLIVGRGTGTWGPRMRLWHPGEILRITLRSK